MTEIGALVTLEGIDGTGKSTQAGRLARTLGQQGHDVLLTREPGGTAGAEGIRKLILDNDQARWSPASELLLFFAARCNHVEQCIRPAIKAGKIVICDRFTDSTRVYQSMRGDAGDVLESINARLVDMEPDLTLVLQTRPELARERIRQRGEMMTHFEQVDQQRLADLIEGFERIIARFPERCVPIDADRNPDVIAREIAVCVLDRLVRED